MMKNIAIVAGIAVVVLLSAVGYAVFRPPEEASGPIEAVPLATETPQEVAVVDDTATPAPTEDAAPAEDVPPTEEATVETEASTPTTEPAAADTPQAESETAAGEQTTFEIVPGESEARFLIDEVLRGEDTTVVGTTDQVAGQLAIDTGTPSNTRIGTIRVNARTLATDSSFRDRAIKNRILNTNEYEFIEFTPTEVSGLPDSATVGETYTFQITGDLTIRFVTREVVFDATVTPISQTELEGTATTTIAHADYDIIIPDAQAVTSVGDTVTLELDFVARAAAENA